MVRTRTKRTVCRFGELNAALTAVQSSLSRATLHARIHHFVPCGSCSRTEMPRDDSVETRQPLVELPRHNNATQMRPPFADYRAFALTVLLLAGIFLPAVCSAEELTHWWSDPCDKLRKVRHEGSQEVHTQLKNVITNLKNDLSKLKNIFKTVCIFQKKPTFFPFKPAFLIFKSLTYFCVHCRPYQNITPFQSTLG